MHVSDLFLIAGIVLIAFAAVLFVVVGTMLWPERFGAHKRRQRMRHKGLIGTFKPQPARRQHEYEQEQMGDLA